jgi:hypothetical protein
MKRLRSLVFAKITYLGGGDRSPNCRSEVMNVQFLVKREKVSENTSSAVGMHLPSHKEE